MAEPRAPRALRIAAAAAILVLAFAGSWNHALWMYDEPREAELARAMWRSGGAAFTVLNEQPFLEKPPLFSASVAAAFALVGQPSILAARVVATLWSLVPLALVAWLGKKTGKPGVALLATLVLETTNRFWTCQHSILLDNALVAFTTAAIAFGWVAATERRRGLAVLAGGALAGAFLVKGLVGVGLAVLVLGLDVARRRDREGAKTLLHPLALLAAVAPPAVYMLVLAREGGEHVREMFWENQVGRFVAAYSTKPTAWHFYAVTCWELVAPWTPLVALALLRRQASDTSRFLATWFVAPLVVLSFSQARARNYAIPVTPASALLVALFWYEVVLPRWTREVLAVAWLTAATAIAGAAFAVAWIGEADLLAVLAALVALGSLPLRRSAVRESLGLGLGLVVVAAWLFWASDFVAERREPRLSFKELAATVRTHAGERRLILFHNNDSYSGAFGFYADRSVLGFDAIRDPLGAKLIATVSTRDVVFAPAGALDVLPEAQRRELVPEWTYESPWDEQYRFVLYRRRTAP